MRQTAVFLKLLVAGTLLSGGAAFAVDASLMNLVMPNAKILGGVNATNAEISPLGQFIISKAGVNGPELQKFIVATGFNPLQDVTEVLAATAADPANPGGLVLALGNFPVDRVVAALAGKANAQVQTYGGATLISGTNANANANAKAPAIQAVAFIGTSIAIAGDLGSVKAAIDRSTSSNSIDPVLAVKVNQLSGSEDEWLVSSVSVASLLPANAGASATGPGAQVLPLFKNIQSFAGGVKLGTNVVFNGEAVTSDANNAAALQAVIKLGVAMATSYTGDNNVHLSEVLPLLQTLQVSTSGPAVDLALSIPEAQIESLVNSVPTRAVVAGRERPARSGTQVDSRNPIP